MKFLIRNCPTPIRWNYYLKKSGYFGKFIVGFLLLLFIFFTAWGQDNKKPNVLFIIADDLTYSAVSCYANPLNVTPNIDKLASEATK